MGLWPGAQVIWRQGGVRVRVWVCTRAVLTCTYLGVPGVHVSSQSGYNLLYSTYAYPLGFRDPGRGASFEFAVSAHRDAPGTIHPSEHASRKAQRYCMIAELQAYCS